MITLELLGGLSVDGDGLSANARVRQRKPMALLAIIAGAAPRPLSREHATALLWPESDEDRARNSLRQAVFQIRKDLGEEVLVSDASGALSLDPEQIHVDLWAFREALENNRLDAAVAAYGGPFLDGYRTPGGSELDHWVDGTRRELTLSYIEALDALGTRARAEGRYDEAVRLRRALVVANPLSSRAARSLLEALTDAGDRTGALDYAAVYSAMVEDELGVEPDPGVTEFAERLRADPELGVRAAPPPAPDADASSADAEPALPTSGPDGVSPVPNGSRAPESWGSLRRAAAAAVLVALGFVLGRWEPRSNEPLDVSSANEPIAVFVSGASPLDGRDPGVRLVACTGPSCPEGPLPTAAWVVPRSGEYGEPPAGSRFISAIRDGTSPARSLECCTTAVFEMEFETPPGLPVARIDLRSLADDRATFAVNGVPIGGHPGELPARHFLAPGARFTSEFEPSADGRNVLRITLDDTGGAMAVQFAGEVTGVDAASTPRVAEEGTSVAAPGGVIMLGSGARVYEGRDPDLRLVSCEGPGCTDEPFPQRPWVVAKAGAYAPPARGTNFVSTRPDGTRLGGEGLACCTTAVFEIEFDAPDDATSARIVFTTLADNRVLADVNGVRFGEQSASTDDLNFLEPSVFVHDFIPSLAGPNVLRVTLEDWGGQIALQFQAFVSFGAD